MEWIDKGSAPKSVIANGRLSLARRTSDTNVEEIGVWMSGMWPGAEAGAEAPRAA